MDTHLNAYARLAREQLRFPGDPLLWSAATVAFSVYVVEDALATELLDENPDDHEMDEVLHMNLDEVYDDFLEPIINAIDLVDLPDGIAFVTMVRPDWPDVVGFVRYTD